VKYRFGRTAEAVTAAAPSGSIHSGVVWALASRHIASVDVAVARYLPAVISSSSLPATSYGLAPSCRILTGLTGCLHSRHTSTLSLVSLRRSSRAGSRPLTPCNVLAAAERRSALNLCKMHRIRPRPRCIPRFHLPLKRYPWRLVVSEGHLDHRWVLLGPPVTCVLSSPNASGAAHGLCRRHCTSQVADRSHGRVGCRSWPTAGGRATSCIGRRYSTTKASNSTVHLGLVAHRESCTHTWK